MIESEYINIDRQVLIEELRHRNINIKFRKMNNEERTMKCTLRNEIIVKSKSKNKKNNYHKNSNTLSVWDIDKNDWRSFRLDRVISWE